jgi:Acyl-CoA thioesterase C-terminal domain
MQPAVALVPGESITPEERALVAADAASGVSSVLDWREWRFLNADLDVVFTRRPRGEWVCLDAETRLAADGLGTCTSVLRDAAGPFGHGTQALVVQRPR